MQITQPASRPGVSGSTSATSILPDEERGELAALLLRSLEPDDGDELTGKEWETVWGAEIDRRMREAAEGKVELIDGDEVDARVRAMLNARRP